MKNKTKNAILKIQVFLIKIFIAFLTFLAIIGIFGAIALIIKNF